MKYLILIFILAFGFTSCSYNIPKSITVNYVDFVKYYQKGFMFTPQTQESYSGKYEAIGILQITCFNGTSDESYHMVSTTDTAKNKGSNHVYGYNSVNDKNIESDHSLKFTSENAIDSFYKQAIKRGANACLAFKINNIYNTDKVINGYEVSGFLIKKP